MVASAAAASKVENLHASVRRQIHVFGLEIAVNEAFRVGCRKSVGDRHGYFNGTPPRDRSPLDASAQSFALEQLRDGVADRAGRPDVEDGEDVGM